MSEGADRDAILMQVEQKSMLSQWFATPGGQYVLDWERRQFDNAVEDVFGFNAVQIGLPDVDFLRESRISLRVRAGLDSGCGLLTEAQCLPLASQSIDLLVLPHVLEFSAQPHQILREAERVLMPEGSIVISGFNPLSLWGAKSALWGGNQGYPWSGKYISLLRLKDWLALLGFELNGGRFGCYAPPFSQAHWLERSAFMEKAGDRWWPICGSAYVVRAVKHVVGMRLVTPNWRHKRAANEALAPVAQNGIHKNEHE
jgi:SAM-dependent methyltransferase